VKNELALTRAGSVRKGIRPTMEIKLALEKLFGTYFIRIGGHSQEYSLAKDFNFYGLAADSQEYCFTKVFFFLSFFIKVYF